MDFTTALKPDLYRTTVVVLLPGALASVPWMALVYWPEIVLTSHWKDAAAPTAIAILAVSLVVGMILENLGSRLEAEHLDKACARALGIDEKKHAAVWKNYLGTRSDRNRPLVAERYLSSLLTRFKFELSMIFALASLILALLVSLGASSPLNRIETVSLVVVSAIFIEFLLTEAQMSASRLHEVRLIILDEAGQA